MITNGKIAQIVSKGSKSARKYADWLTIRNEEYKYQLEKWSNRTE